MKVENNIKKLKKFKKREILAKIDFGPHVFFNGASRGQL